MYCNYPVQFLFEEHTIPLHLNKRYDIILIYIAWFNIWYMYIRLYICINMYLYSYKYESISLDRNIIGKITEIPSRNEQPLITDVVWVIHGLGLAFGDRSLYAGTMINTRIYRGKNDVRQLIGRSSTTVRGFPCSFDNSRLEIYIYI